MLSYQHSYHAGNFADVVKHIILVEVLEYLKSKPKPILCIDTHAGRGGYRLNEAAARKNQEYLGGIARLLQSKDLPDSFKSYLDIVKNNNPASLLTFYPGSPILTAQLLTEHDRLFCYELHPGEFRNLQQALIPYPKAKALRKDGLSDTLSLLPPGERRGLVLIDPSYELKNDYVRVVEALRAMYRKFSTGCYLLWYPVVNRERNRMLEKTLIASDIVNIQLFELGIMPDSTDYGMTACGMIVVNPPWTLKPSLEKTLPWLAACLGIENQGSYRIEQLVSE